jgi:O-antigen ligase
MGIILHLTRFRRRITLRDAGWWLVLAMLVAALVLSKSRTSMTMLAAALIVSFTVLAYQRRGSIVLPAVLLIAAAAFTAGILFASDWLDVVGDGVLSAATRSGDTSELTTLTGRVDIWSVAIKVISDNPVIGYGWRSSESVLTSAWFERYGQTAFYPVHPHSMYLNVMLSTGLVGASLLLISLTNLRRQVAKIPIWFAKDRRATVWLPLIFFWAGVGLTENSALGTTNTSFVLFMLMIADVSWHVPLAAANKLTAKTSPLNSQLGVV